METKITPPTQNPQEFVFAVREDGTTAICKFADKPLAAAKVFAALIDYVENSSEKELIPFAVAYALIGENIGRRLASRIVKL